MAYGIWDAEGRAIAIPEGFLPRLISSSFPIRCVKEKVAGRIKPGDVYLTNSPKDGALHLSDWTFIRPIFYHDELLFFTCMVALVLENNRMSDMMRREMASLMGSTAVAEQRMVELLDKYGKHTVLASAESMIDRTGAGAVTGYDGYQCLCAATEELRLPAAALRP